MNAESTCTRSTPPPIVHDPRFSAQRGGCNPLQSPDLETNPFDNPPLTPIRRRFFPFRDALGSFGIGGSFGVSSSSLLRVRKVGRSSSCPNAGLIIKQQNIVVGKPFSVGVVRALEAVAGVDVVCISERPTDAVSFEQDVLYESSVSTGARGDVQLTCPKAGHFFVCYVPLGVGASTRSKSTNKSDTNFVPTAGAVLPIFCLEEEPLMAAAKSTVSLKPEKEEYAPNEAIKIEWSRSGNAELYSADDMIALDGDADAADGFVYGYASAGDKPEPVSLRAPPTNGTFWIKYVGSTAGDAKVYGQVSITVKGAAAQQDVRSLDALLAWSDLDERQLSALRDY